MQNTYQYLYSCAVHMLEKPQRAAWVKIGQTLPKRRFILVQVMYIYFFSPTKDIRKSMQARTQTSGRGGGGGAIFF